MTPIAGTILSDGVMIIVWWRCRIQPGSPDISRNKGTMRMSRPF